MSDTPNPPPAETKENDAKGSRSTAILLAVAGLVVALYILVEYSEIAAFESGSTDSIRFNVVEKILYELFGLTGMTIFLGAISVLCFVAAIALAVKAKKPRQKPEGSS